MYKPMDIPEGLFEQTREVPGSYFFIHFYGVRLFQEVENSKAFVLCTCRFGYDAYELWW
jgi:hypothetical protein